MSRFMIIFLSETTRVGGDERWRRLKCRLYRRNSLGCPILTRCAVGYNQVSKVAFQAISRNLGSPIGPFSVIDRHGRRRVIDLLTGIAIFSRWFWSDLGKFRSNRHGSVQSIECVSKRCSCAWKVTSLWNGTCFSNEVVLWTSLTKVCSRQSKETSRESRTGLQRLVLDCCLI